MKTLIGTLLFCLLHTGWLQAQDKIQVVTKTITQSFAFASDESLLIEAEKANVRIKGWDRPDVQVVLKLIAKHPTRTVAERDLSALHYQFTTQGSKKLLKNFFQLTDERFDITSNLRADYEVWVPHQRTVTVNNRYGTTELSDWRANLYITVEFGEVLLEQISGSVTLDVTYGDVTAQHTRGLFTAIARKSNLNLYQVEGAMSLKSNYGEINITTQDRLHQISVDATRTKVTFSTADPMHYRYCLTTTGDEIHVPVPGNWANEGSLVRKQSFTTTEDTLPLVDIKTSFNPITINFLQHEASPRTHRP